MPWLICHDGDAPYKCTKLALVETEKSHVLEK